MPLLAQRMPVEVAVVRSCAFETSGWCRSPRGSARFVYEGARDFMRGVSAHVGAACKGEKKLDHSFVLVREDP